MVVSRDVVFDETKGWSWNKTSLEQSQDMELDLTLGRFVNHGAQGMIEAEKSSAEDVLEDTEHDVVIRVPRRLNKRRK